MVTHTLNDRYTAAKEELTTFRQEHALRFYDELDEVGRARLLNQIEGIDWPEVARLIETHVKKKPTWQMPEQVEPVDYYPHEPTADLQAKYAEAREHGEALIRAGKVAAFCVAGGQGSRLGWEGPKGTFPATPIREAPLFQVFAEFIQNVQKRFDAVVPFYIMTSPINHADTVAFWEENQHFGLDPQNVMFFPQAMFPAVDMQTAKVLLADKDALALSPNGHGGSLKALYTSGAIDDMKQRGIEQISYIQVDNPLVRVIDPLFVGLHALDGAGMSSKMLIKAHAKEKVGNFCVVDGRVTVIEYSNLPDDIAEQTTDDGELRFRAGSIALHALKVDFVESLNTAPGGFALPWNRAEKKVAYYDDQTGRVVTPDEPNAVKLETFVFDALPLSERSIVYETLREDDFAPIKNASGEGVADSPDTSKRMQIEQAAAWLEANGVDLPRNAQGETDAVIEIKRTTAIYPEDLKGAQLPTKIEPGQRELL